MKYASSVLETIGRTPLVRLARVVDDVKPLVLAKVEFFNPGGSVKDRVGLVMVEAAEREGLLHPGSTIVEATAGNTGVGLALAAAVKGYRCIFVMPDKMSDDKVNLLRAYGAEVVITPTNVPPDSPESYNGVADRLAREIPNAFRPNQFANQNNPRAHYETTGPEIWEDTEGKVDVLVAGMGTGGTISGTGRYLKERKPGVVVVGADPEGSILSGDSPRSYKVEGIGEDFIPATFDRQVVDDFVRVSDAESFLTARRLAREEGLLVGGSAGTAVAAALKYAQRLDASKVVVVILPDTGRNYLSKLYSDRWMEANGYPLERKGAASVAQVLQSKAEPARLVAVSPDDSPLQAAEAMERHGISQIPVIDGERVVGSITEATLARLLVDGVERLPSRVGEVMGKPLPVVDADAELAEAYRLLLAGHPGLMVARAGRPLGIITRIDLVHYWLRGAEKEAGE
ncbi:MAG: cystathionine beta-synthase [Chloroflexota bacterium]